MARLWTRASGPAAAVSLWTSALLASSCDASRPPRPDERPAGLAARAAATASVCAPTGAHGRHAAEQICCSTCHGCGGAVAFTTIATYPRGTTSAGTYDVTVTPPTCSVGCHAPMGSAAHPVRWSDPAPLACVACHDVSTFPAGHTTRFPHSPPTRDDCVACHDMSAHTSGTVRAVCGTCHDIPPRNVYGHGYHTACTWCHFDVANAAGTAITNAALHMDGVVEVVDNNTTPECMYCHVY
ncbi:MAG TPA: hypothetical protein VM753_15755 [Anaeromyxobacter sp.]|jgi:hypothetical protein|nr:hypothetical protein [Anaeromyxobacter sp.]